MPFVVEIPYDFFANGGRLDVAFGQAAIEQMESVPQQVIPIALPQEITTWEVREQAPRPVRQEVTTSVDIAPALRPTPVPRPRPRPLDPVGPAFAKAVEKLQWGEINPDEVGEDFRNGIVFAAEDCTGQELVDHLATWLQSRVTNDEIVNGKRRITINYSHTGMGDWRGILYFNVPQPESPGRASAAIPLPASSASEISKIEAVEEVPAPEETTADTGKITMDMEDLPLEHLPKDTRPDKGETKKLTKAGFSSVRDVNQKTQVPADLTEQTKLKIERATLIFEACARYRDQKVDVSIRHAEIGLTDLEKKALEDQEVSSLLDVLDLFRVKDLSDADLALLEKKRQLVGNNTGLDLKTVYEAALDALPAELVHWRLQENGNGD